MAVLLKNNAVGFLAAAIDSSNTSASLTSGSGANFPTIGSGDYFYATLAPTSGNTEIVKVNARSGDTLSITRAQEGTVALAFAAGSRVELRVTAQAVIDAIEDRVSAKDQASEIGFTPYANISATNVQAAIQEEITDLAASGGAALIGYVSGTGAVETTVQEKLRRICLDAKDYGMVGDGVTDDTAAFLNLRNRARALKSVVVVQPGTYILQQATELSANDTIWQFTPGSIFKLKNTQATTSFLTISAPLNQKIYGLRVDADRLGQDDTLFGEDNAAVLVVDSKDCKFSGGEIISSPGKGFVLVSTPGGLTRDVVIKDFKGAECSQQVLNVDGNNITGLFERVIINGVRIGKTYHAGLTLNDGVHNVIVSDVISDVQNTVHDAISIRDSFDIQMSNVKGRRGRGGISIERLNAYTGRIQLNNITGEDCGQNGVLFLGAEDIQGGSISGLNSIVGVNIAATGAGYRSNNIQLGRVKAVDFRGTSAQQYGLLVQGADDVDIGQVDARNSIIRDVSVLRAGTSNIKIPTRQVVSVSTGAITSGSDAVVTATWPTDFEDSQIVIESLYVVVGTSGLALEILHVVAITATVVQVKIRNISGITQTGMLTVSAVRAA